MSTKFYTALFVTAMLAVILGVSGCASSHDKEMEKEMMEKESMDKEVMDKDKEMMDKEMSK